MTLPTWQSARHLLATWDGSATELFVTDLPISQVSVVVAALATLPDVIVTSFQDGLSCPDEPLDAQWRTRLEASHAGPCLHTLVSARDSPTHLQIYLWLDVDTLEVELVFWNDRTFPPGLETAERDRRLGVLLSLAEKCRAGVPNARCVLVGEWNGPTEELLSQPDIVVW